ncbi:ESX secretion-associated protein EspG [Actinophytocola gossypii]|uniref:ESX secretion-associated protein EspG n=1 Tax=Actinophytocola gossypii TaxID=2812003 RepID=A0ABT2JFE0_9PSEU|nr:ESX secretion-associated protein EspG [Actinophytocola gossypii]MCT2585999.1 ESX secretion-associated protein EspG [Actinophytocola gossypii]
MTTSDTVRLTALEFDVIWERERLPRRHEALGLPSPGRTHTERAQLVAEALAGLTARGLADGERADAELVDQLNLLARPQVCLDSWVWSDREIRALTVVAGNQALLAVVDSGEVWLIPARDTAIAEAAVSVCGEAPAGPGRSVSVPTDLLTAADADARGDSRLLASALIDSGVSGSDAKTLAGMVDGIGLRGQFGANRVQRDGRMVRADRVVAFHDTHHGRYAHLAKPNNDGRRWSTVTPADNRRLAMLVEELLDEV